MGLSLSHLLLLLFIVLIVFGAGRLPRVMNDVGKGIRSLRDGLKGEEDDKPEAPRSLPPRTLEQSADAQAREANDRR